MTVHSEPRIASFSEADRTKHLAKLFADAVRVNGGPRGWKLWKRVGVEDLVALASRAPRVTVLAIDMSADLHLAFHIHMPIPRWPSNGKLAVGTGAIFHLVYRDEWRTLAPKGWEPVGIVNPIDVFHPNAKPNLRGALCLGRLPAGITPKELLLLSYHAGTLQTVQLAEDDPEGVLNAAACEFFRCNPRHLPLTRAGLSEDWDPEGDN